MYILSTSLHFHVTVKISRCYVNTKRGDLKGDTARELKDISLGPAGFFSVLTTEKWWKTRGNEGKTHGIFRGKHYPIGSMYTIYATFTINIPQMLAYIPYMDPMG